MVINFIENAVTLSDVRSYLPFQFHELKGKRRGTYSIYLGRKTGFRLILISVGEDGKKIQGVKGSCQFEKIRKVKILEVSPHYE